MYYSDEFWEFLNKLVIEKEIVIDRPKGTKHPKYSNMVYECYYGIVALQEK